MIVDPLKIWWRALRAYSFAATFIPVLVAFLFARAQGLLVMWAIFPLLLFGVLLLHAGVNLLNDYYDFILGFDTDEARGSSGLLTGGLVPPTYMSNWGRFYVIAGAFTGLVLAAICGWPLLLVGWIGGAGAWFYSHRAGYKYKGLGEPFVFILMGVLLFGGAFYAATRTLTIGVIWPAMACGSLVTAILLVNNLRDLDMDKQAGFITLPMRLGAEQTKILFVVLMATAYVAPVLAMLTGAAHIGLLLPLASLPLAGLRTGKICRARNLSTELANEPQAVAQLYLLFGMLLAAGLFFFG